MSGAGTSFQVIQSPRSLKLTFLLYGTFLPSAFVGSTTEHSDLASLRLGIPLAVSLSLPTGHAVNQPLAQMSLLSYEYVYSDASSSLVVLRMYVRVQEYIVSMQIRSLND